MWGMSTKPAKEFHAGRVRVSIWHMPVAIDGSGENEPYAIIVEKRSRLGAETQSAIGFDDIPKAMLALKRAYEWIRGMERQSDAPKSNEGGFVSAEKLIPERIP